MNKSKILMVINSVLTIICLANGMLAWSVHSGTGLFIVWFAMTALFGILAVMAYLGWIRDLYYWVPKVVRKVALGVFLVILVCVVTTEGLILSGFCQHPQAKLDYLVVLGAQVRIDGPSTVLKYRLNKAAAYLKKNPDTLCIVTGTQANNEPTSEAKCMRDYLVKKGIDKDRIIMEDLASNTVQNISFSMKYFDEKTDSIGIVTNNFHIFRSMQIAKKLGVKHVCGMPSDTPAAFLFSNMMRECVAVWKDFICRNI